MSCKLAMEGLALCLAISVQVLVAEAGLLHGRPPAMYVLGDSILDVGNNNYLPGADVFRANRPYYGIDFPGMIPTGRFGNGFNTADYIAKTMGFVLSPPPFLLLTANRFSLLLAALTTGVNYASGGAGILDSTNAGRCIPLSRQVEYFRATRAKMVAAVGSRAADARLSKSIFLISAGTNDLFVSPAQQPSDAAAALVADLISNYSAIITDLYDMGARKLAIINLEPIGCVPKERVTDPAGACADGLNQLAAGFDGELRSLLAGLASRLPGLVYSIGDYFRVTQDIFADPQALGYTDIAGACCGSGRLLAEGDCLPNATVCYNRDQHVFFDRVHPSQRTAFLTAQAFYDGPAQYTTPINFKQLFNMTAA